MQCPCYATDSDLAGKFNILKGIDIPWQPGHQAGVNLGNFTQSGLGLGKPLKVAYTNPTMDQVMAYSSNFYSTEDLRNRSIWATASASTTKNPSPSPVKWRSKPLSELLFSYLFKASSSLGGMDQLIVDRVKESYDQLKASPKLSKGDFLRLEQHMEKMFEVERLVALDANLTDLPSPPNGNTDSWTYKESFGTIPHNLNATEQYLNLMLDVVVAGLSSGE